MVTFYTKLIIHIKDTSSLNTLQNKQATSNHETLDYNIHYQTKERRAKYFKAIKLKRENHLDSFSNSYIDSCMKVITIFTTVTVAAN